MNRSEFIGRITKDLELQTTTNGISVCKFTLAVNRKFANADGEKEADFINCVVWRKTAENISKYCKKGSLIYLSGELQTRSYEAQDGSKRYITEIIVNEVEFLNTKTSEESYTKGKVAETTKIEPIDDDALPF